MKKQVIILFAFLLGLFTVQAKNEIKKANEFKPIDIVSVYEMPLQMVVNFEVPAQDVIHQNQNIHLNYENFKTPLSFSDTNVSVSNGFILQNYQAKYQQNYYNYQGLYYKPDQSYRYISGFTKSRYLKTQGDYRQINRSCNYKEIQICKVEHQTCWQHYSSRMYNGRAERADRIAKRDYKPLQGNFYTTGRYYNYPTKIHSKNSESFSVDWWSNTLINYWRCNTKIC